MLGQKEADFMLEKPHDDGWSRLQLFDVDIEINCYFGKDCPFNWLKACQFGLENRLPATLFFDAQDSGTIVVVIADDSHTTIFIDDAYDGKLVHIYDYYNIMNLTEDIFMDISRDFDSWTESIYCFGDPRYFSRKDIEFQNKMRTQGQYFRETERVELRLKTALQETESAYLKRKWKAGR